MRDNYVVFMSHSNIPVQVRNSCGENLVIMERTLGANLVWSGLARKFLEVKFQ